MKLFDKVVESILPPYLRKNNTHPRHDEFRVLTSAAVISLPALVILPVFLIFLEKPFWGYYLNVFLIIIMLFCIRFLGHYRLPMSILAIITYFILYDLIRQSGFIYSAQMGILHIYLLAAIWVDKKWGWLTIFTNILVFIIIYSNTNSGITDAGLFNALGNPVYALLLHCFITIFLGGFLAFEQFDQERNRKKIRALQDQRISLLDEAVKDRTDQLSNIRQIMAADFHDETGNMLSAITRQATMLKMQLSANNPALPVVESIIRNSNELYATSKDFLWNLNYNSDNPIELFNYLTSHGQSFYNQFDIAFSSVNNCPTDFSKQINAFASLSLIFIFKETMTNTVRHSGANEVVMEINCIGNYFIYSVKDDGRWKVADNTTSHYGLSNIERRCQKHNFDFIILKRETGTTIEVHVPAVTKFS